MMDQPELPYQVKIENFEGPLDLLLHLIKKNEINIYDIPIALIAQQYLDYLSVMKELNLAVAGEFLVMAATLLHIKSRMLLPVDEVAVDEEDGPDELRANVTVQVCDGSTCLVPTTTSLVVPLTTKA